VGDRPGFTHFDGVMIWQLTGSNIPHPPPFTAWPEK
jgi:hypothetical protein